MQFIVKKFEEDLGVWYGLQVTGYGTNKETGEPINFYTTQTGL